MSWGKWLGEKRFTLYRSAIIQEQFIECILDHCNGGKILETGFGFATTTELLRDLGYDVYGIDLEPRAIEDAIKRYPSLRGKLRVGDILDPSVYTDSYESIIHQGVLEHFCDADIQEILRLQSGKCKNIIFDVPNSLRQNKESEGVMTRFESPEFWEQMIGDVGLEYERFGRTYDGGDDLLPSALRHYNSDLMKKVGRSSIFVVKGKVR